MRTRILVGWRRAFIGPDVALVAPDGAGAGLIRVRQRVTPLRAVSTVFAPVIARQSDARIEGPMALVTTEGEHAAVVNARGPQKQHTAGIVYGDHHYAFLEAYAGRPELHEPVRSALIKLVARHCLGLGSDRWRRFFYEPPVGWAPIVRPFATCWAAPTCPRPYQTITVFHARPPRGGEEMITRQHLFESLPADFGKTPPMPPVYEQTRDGLPVQVVSYSGRPAGRPQTTIVSAIVRDNRYLYPFRLECDTEALAGAGEIFRDLVLSMRPVPSRAATSAVMDSGWVE